MNNPAPDYLLRIAENTDAEDSFERQLLKAVRTIPPNRYEGRRRVFDVVAAPPTVGRMPWRVHRVEDGVRGEAVAEFETLPAAKFYAMMLNGLFERLVSRYLHYHRGIEHIDSTARAVRSMEGF